MTAIPPVIPVPAVVSPVPSPATIVTPVHVVQVPAPAGVPFSLTLGSFHANDIVNLSFKLGRDLYNKATATIAIPFDGSSKNINLFHSQLLRRAENAGWNSDTGDILTVPDTYEDTRNVITEYGCVTEDHIIASATVDIGTQTRQAQNNAMMVECL